MRLLGTSKEDVTALHYKNFIKSLGYEEFKSSGGDLSPYFHI